MLIVLNQLINLKGKMMKDIPEWLQAVTAIALFLAAGAGIYASNLAQMAQFDERLKFVERQQRQDHVESILVLKDLATSVDKLSISVARLEERLKAVEKEQ